MTDGPEFKDVVREVKLPEKARTILEEAAAQTAAISRLADVSHEMAEWRILQDRRFGYQADMLIEKAYDVVFWLKMVVTTAWLVPALMAILMFLGK